MRQNDGVFLLFESFDFRYQVERRVYFKVEVTIVIEVLGGGGKRSRHGVVFYVWLKPVVRLCKKTTLPAFCSVLPWPKGFFGFASTGISDLIK
jgi:hypothetical protein